MKTPQLEKNLRIIVIDDNRAIHADFRKILCGSGETGGVEKMEEELFGKPAVESRSIAFQVDSAYQGQEGLEMVQRAVDEGRPYAMAFMDVRMPPGWDGIETTSKIWAVDPELQVVLCTAYSDYSWSEMIDQIGYSHKLLILKSRLTTSKPSSLRRRSLKNGASPSGPIANGRSGGACGGTHEGTAVCQGCRRGREPRQE